MFNQKIYKKTKEDVKAILHALNESDDEAIIWVADLPSDKFIDSKGEVQALFLMSVGDEEFKISRRLKEYLIEKEVLIP